MKILNPLYDWAFKYLLDNNDLAKKFLTAILKQNVTHLETRNIELPLLKEGNPFITRFDFKAIIETNGTTEEVLIEIQKYRSANTIGRFRTYLGENYLKEETYKDTAGTVQKSTLPLIAVYILGYCPPEFTVPYVIVRNKIYNGIDETELSIESPMVKQLTHKAYFLITTPPKGYEWQNSRQEAIIRLFRQKIQKAERNTIYELETIPNDEIARQLADYLNLGTQEETIIKQLRAEEEYYEDLGNLEAALKKTEQEKEAAQQREEEERRQKEEAQQREEEERRQKAKIQEESAKEFLKLGLSIDKISQLTGLSIEDIKKLK